MPISSLVAHALLNRIQVIMSAVELGRREYAGAKLRELANFIVSRTETETEIAEIQEPGKPGEKPTQPKIGYAVGNYPDHPEVISPRPKPGEK